jgi:hypothetical protein
MPSKPSPKPRTPYSDANGNLKDGFRDSWDRKLVDQWASADKVPSHWTRLNGSDLPAGSREWEDSGDLGGCVSGLIYELGLCLQGLDTRGDLDRMNLGRVMHLLSWLEKLADLAGMPPNPEIRVKYVPYGVYEWRANMYRVNGWPFPVEVSDTVNDVASELGSLNPEEYDGFGAPNGPEHDSHAHGLANGAWYCSPEDN